ncbi:hypothetical protein Abci_025_017 [Acetobacter cibinongensis]|nr:hypothetical protein Abci_025_017 [Acetobacter cibinongensis]
MSPPCGTLVTADVRQILAVWLAGSAMSMGRRPVCVKDIFHRSGRTSRPRCPIKIVMCDGS